LQRAALTARREPCILANPQTRGSIAADVVVAAHAESVACVAARRFTGWTPRILSRDERCVSAGVLRTAAPCVNRYLTSGAIVRFTATREAHSETRETREE
jgi:hypothetical protein